MMRAELAGQGHTVAVISARTSPTPRPEVLGSLPTAAQGRPDALISTARAFAPDVVHVQFAVAAYGARIPSLLRLLDGVRAAGLPVVITMHEVTRDTESLRGAGRALYRQLARRADRVIVHTERARIALADEIAPELPPPAVIGHPQVELPAGGVDAALLRRRFRLGDAQVLLAFGFIDVDKGLGDLVTAAGQLQRRDQLNGVRIVIAGDVRRRFGAFRIFELRDRLHLRSVKRRVSKFGLTDRVLFVGFVPEDEVRAWFEAAALAVLPYRRSEQSGVGSLAAAAGTPLLTSNVGDLPAISAVEPFPAADAEALADRLSQFLSEGPSRPARVATGGDLPEIAADTAALYRELIDGLTRPRLQSLSERETDHGCNTREQRVVPANVSVVVCTHNGARSLPTVLGALARQDMNGLTYELVVVTDHCVDGCADIASAAGARVVDVVGPGGVGAARNAGIKESSGDIVAFTDDDCEPDSTWLTRLTAPFADDSIDAVAGLTVPASDRGLVFGYIAARNPLAPLPATLLDSRRPLSRLYNYLRVGQGPSERLPQGTSLLAGATANMAFRRRLLDVLGGFDSTITFGGEEEDLCRRAHEQLDGVRFVYQSDAVVRHHYRPGFRDSLRRARGYGRGNARAAMSSSAVSAIVYPFPLITLTAAVVAAPRGTKNRLMVSLLPPLLYCRWVGYSARERKLGPLTFPYLQLAQEVATMVGEVEQLLASIRARPEARPRHRDQS